MLYKTKEGSLKFTPICTGRSAFWRSWISILMLWCPGCLFLLPLKVLTSTIGQKTCLVSAALTNEPIPVEHFPPEM